MKTLVIILISLRSFTALAQFDNINWGMSMEQVIRLDSLKDPIRTTSTLQQKEYLGPLLIEKVYSFEKDKLIGLALLYSKSDVKLNTEQYALKTFSEENRIFSDSFGEPYRVKLDGPYFRVWKTSEFKLIIEVTYDKDVGFAVKREYLLPDWDYEGIDY